MSTSIRRLCCFLLMLPVVAGCWNRQELNELAIAVGLGVDKAGDQYRVSVQVVDPGEIDPRGAGRNRTPVALFTVDARSLLEAGRKMSTISPREIYPSHLRVFIVGEEVAREGLNPVLDHITRGAGYRSDFFILIAKGQTKAEDTLKTLTSLEKIPANKVLSSLETSEEIWSATSTKTIDDLVDDLLLDGREAVLSGIEVRGSPVAGQTQENVSRIESKAQLQYTGLGVFRDDKLVGWLNTNESKGFNYIMNKVQQSVGVVPCPEGGQVTMHLMQAETKRKVRIEGGRPIFELTSQSEQNIAEVACAVDLDNEQSIHQLEKSSEQVLEGLMTQAVAKIQKEYRTDILGFGETLHQYHPKLWKTLKDNWDEVFVDVPVRIEAKVKIRRFGTKTNVLNLKSKE